MSERFVYCSSERRYGLRLVVGQNLILMGRYEKSVRFAAVLVGCVLRGLVHVKNCLHHRITGTIGAFTRHPLSHWYRLNSMGHLGHRVIYHRSQSTDIFRLSCIRIRNRGRHLESEIQVDGASQKSKPYTVHLLKLARDIPNQLK